MTNSAFTRDTTLQRFRVDPAHSQVSFAVRHMGFSKVRGRFQEFDGTVRMVPDRLDTLDAEASVQVATISTGDEKRDNHLRSEDFFVADQFPKMTFESDGVSEVNGSSANLAGALTIRGITKRVVFDVEYLGEATDPWGGTRAAFEAEATVNRKDFGLSWNQILETGGMLVGEAVEITLEIQAVREEE